MDHIPAMAGKCVSNGRLNAFFAIAEPDTVPPGMINDLATTDPGSNTMGLTWTATGDDGLVGTATYYEVRYSTSTITSGNWDSAMRAGNEPTPQVSGSAESMEVHNLVSSTNYFFAVKAFDEWGNAGPISNIATGQTLPPPTGQVAPTSVSDELMTGQQSDHTVTLSNIGVGTLDFSIPSPVLGEPQSAPAPPLDLGKDDVDPRSNGPVVANSGGPDGFGYRWIDSDEAGGPTFAWQDISATGTDIGLTGDDQTTPPIALGFNFPLYGTLFSSINVCSNGWLSFTSNATSYSNQPLPGAGGPANLVAPFWDDLNPSLGGHVYFQTFGNSAIIQWDNVPHYTGSGSGTYTFQAILDSSGTITYQYLSMVGTLDSATIGIQDAAQLTGLQVAFNQAYMHDNLAVRIAAIPQWLTVSPTSGRLGPGASKILNLHMNAAGLEGGTYPGDVHILTNDPNNPDLLVSASLHVIGAPNAQVQPLSLPYGTVFLSQPYEMHLTVANIGTDTLHVSDITSTDPTLVPSPATFNVAPHGSQDVVVTWTPGTLGAFSGTLTVLSDDAGDPHIDVSVTGNAVPTPVMVWTPSSFNETLFTGNMVTRTLTVSNTGGPDLIVDAAADLGGGQLVYADDVSAQGAGGPDAFGYKWKDSDESGGPAFNFIDISATGTQISFTSSDDALSAAIPMGMTFPFYGSNFSSIKVGTNGFLTFDTTDTASRLGNYELPSTNGAKFMLALLWDDLHLRSGNVKYEYDGTRFIVQYTNVEKYSPSGFPMTFQVQLYPNGKILYEYQTMPAGGTYNSLTIGIQDGTKTVGLTSDYNANFVHENMAIQFSRTPDWLAVSPSHAQIPPGGHQDFSVTFDSTDRLGGTLMGNVVLNTNVPGQAQELVPATLHVIGVPIATIVPASYDYGTRFTGYAYPVSFQVVNTGTDVMNVSGVTSDDPTLTVQDQGGAGNENIPEAAFPLAPGASHLFQMTWSPASPATLNTLIHVLSDDPVTPNKTMAVTGLAIPPPVAAWTPSSFNESMMAGDVLHRTLHLQNNGGSDLNWVSQIGLLSGASVTVDHSPEIKKGDPDTRPGVLGTGGPDMFGYTWRDSDQPGGPAFSWVDLTAIGTPVTFSSNDDGNSGLIPLGFPFPFYGQNFSSVAANTNGWLSFTNSSTGFYTNYQLPSSSAPENLLALFWDDLYWRNPPANALYYSDGNRFIFEFQNWDQLSPSGESYNMEVILYRNGRIVYQYLSMTTNDILSATIGIQNGTKDDGLTVEYNSAYMHDALAVEFRPPAGWLTISPEAGTIPAGGFTDVDVAFDATQLIGGDYSANIDLSTNDPGHASIRVPAAIHVTGIPDINASPASLAFPTTYVGYSRDLVTNIQNTGTDVLTVTGASISGDFSFTGLTTPVAIVPGGSIPVTVTFAPLAAGSHTGSLDVTSDDPDEPTISVALSGDSLIPPEMHVSPASMSVVLPPDSQTTQTMQICNTGGSDLNWTSGANVINGGTGSPYPPYSLGKDDVDTHPGILGSGGPDAFGYKWTDSDEPGGPVFDWVDITGVGTPVGLTGDDQDVYGIPIGFDFPFYGNPFNSLTVSSNGWMSFSYTGTSTYLTNYALPSSSGPPNMLAGFWDDLSFSSTHGSATAFYYNDGSRFILSFIDVPHYPSTGTGPYTFQYILYPNGKIVYQYLSMGPTQNSATIGIQNATQDDGLNVVFNSDYVHDGLAIAFQSVPQWLTLSPTGGVVPAGGCMDVTATFDSTGLDHGTHDAVARIQAENDPYLDHADVPCTLAVNQKPTADAGTPSMAECTGNNHAAVMLNGTGSSDPDGDPLTYMWSAPGVTFDDATSATPTGSFPLGSTTATLVVNDGYENSDPATVIVTIVDTMPPTITSVTATPNQLWPPNHQMADVNTTVIATDVCDPMPLITLVSATSSEPDDAQGGGDGVTVNDIQDASIGTADFSVMLRAERDGKGTGRDYTLTYQATDHSGNSSATSGATVNVPHDRGNVIEPVVVNVSGASATRVTWGSVTGAQNYDVIRGNLASLRIVGSDIDLGTVTCIAHGIVATSSAGYDDTAVPAPGQAFFYAVQYFDGVQKSSFGSESAGRARVIQPGNGDCP